MKRILPVFAVLLFLYTCALPESDFDDGRAPYDPDLFAWKTASRFPFTTADSISGFAWGGGRYVAVSRTGVIGWSNDGDIWRRAEKVPVDKHDPNTLVDPFTASFNAVAYGGGMFVAVGNNGRIAFSKDGAYWTAWEIHGFTENINGIAYGGGVFVAAGGGAKIASSADGRVWTNPPYRPAGFDAADILNDIAFSESGQTFYIAGEASPLGSGGITGWSALPLGNDWHHYKYGTRNSTTYTDETKDPGYPFFGNPIKKIALGVVSGGVPAIGVVFNEWGGRRHAVSTIENFCNPPHDWDAHLDAGLFGDNNLNGIAFGGGVFVMAGQSAMIGWWPSAEPSSESERYWRALSFREFEWWEITALAALNGRFYAGGIGGKIGYSK